MCSRRANWPIGTESLRCAWKNDSRLRQHAMVGVNGESSEARSPIVLRHIGRFGPGFVACRGLIQCDRVVRGWRQGLRRDLRLRCGRRDFLPHRLEVPYCFSKPRRDHALTPPRANRVLYRIRRCWCTCFRWRFVGVILLLGHTRPIGWDLDRILPVMGFGFVLFSLVGLQVGVVRRRRESFQPSESGFDR